MILSAKGRSDIGLKRSHNEDSFGLFDDLGLYVVADGMGGHAAGEVASMTAVETLRDFIKTAGKTKPADRLTAGIMLANEAIFNKSQASADQRGMGTTIVAALADEDALHVAHVGDSRAYRFLNGSLRRITQDHSYVEELIMAGQLTPEQARTHRLRNIVTRALGTKADVKVDLSRHAATPGEIYLLCSDGLTGMLTDAEIERTINEYQDDPAACADELIRRANAKGGDDNITVLLIKAG